MLQLIQQSLIIMSILFGIKAIYSTIKKERDMVKNGGEPLPTSSYIFLVFEFVVQTILIWVVSSGLDTMFPNLVKDSTVLFITFTLILVTLLTSIVDAIARTIVVIYMTRKITKEREQKEQGLNG